MRKHDNTRAAERAEIDAEIRSGAAIARVFIAELQGRLSALDLLFSQPPESGPGFKFAKDWVYQVDRLAITGGGTVQRDPTKLVTQAMALSVQIETLTDGIREDFGLDHLEEATLAEENDDIDPSPLMLPARA